MVVWGFSGNSKKTLKGCKRELHTGTNKINWNKQNNDVPAPNYMLKVQEEIIKNKGL